jgi:hypothetical protein
MKKPLTFDQLRKRWDKWSNNEREAYRIGRIDGIHAAAHFAGEWDKQISHPYKFADTILCKFNLRKQPRKKGEASR